MDLISLLTKSDKSYIDHTNFLTEIEIFKSGLYRRIRNLAVDLEVEIIDEDSKKILVWNDGILRYASLNLEEVLHELAHCQVALPYQRNLPDFGLGVGPNSNREFYRNLNYEILEIKMFDYNYANNKLYKELYFESNPDNIWGILSVQETLASLLGILWCRKFEIKIAKLLCGQGWFKDLVRLEKILNILQKCEFIDKDYYPLPKLNR